MLHPIYIYYEYSIPIRDKSLDKRELSVGPRASYPLALYQSHKLYQRFCD